jgi:hypothetical protein
MTDDSFQRALIAEMRSQGLDRSAEPAPDIARGGDDMTDFERREVARLSSGVNPVDGEVARLRALMEDDN